MSSIVLAPR